MPSLFTLQPRVSGQHCSKTGNVRSAKLVNVALRIAALGRVPNHVAQVNQSTQGWDAKTVLINKRRLTLDSRIIEKCTRLKFDRLIKRFKP
jgi:hypothetical protein